MDKLVTLTPDEALKQLNTALGRVDLVFLDEPVLAEAFTTMIQDAQMTIQVRLAVDRIYRGGLE